jgi:glutamate 5-kinase
VSTVVIKVGSSSVTRDGAANASVLAALCEEIADLTASGTKVVVVTSGAVALGWSAIGAGAPRPREIVALQAASAVGQHRVMEAWQVSLERHGLIGGQVLLGSLDFGHRQQYLHARRTLRQLLDFGVIPIVNENDATSDEEIRFGDNDRLAALVAQLVDAQHLLLLTDTQGLFTADPRIAADASLISVVEEIDEAVLALAGGTRSQVGSGGMASKVAAARIGTASGVTVTIAEAERPRVIRDCLAGSAVGTRFVAKEKSLSARKLWIAFALTSLGTITIDGGAQRALLEEGRSLLAAGASGVTGEFDAGDPVSVVGPLGLIARGLSSVSSGILRQMLEEKAAGVDRSARGELIHRDDLVILQEPSAVNGKVEE